MSNFPLYENLKNDNAIELDKNKFIKLFKKLSVKSHKLIYVLIRSYQIEHKIDILNSSLPFNGTKMKTGNKIKFDLNKLPPALQLILYKFILLDLKK